MDEYLKKLPKVNEEQRNLALKWVRAFYDGAPLFKDMIEPDVLTYVLKVVLRDLDQNKAIAELMNPKN